MTFKIYMKVYYHNLKIIFRGFDRFILFKCQIVNMIVLLSSRSSIFIFFSSILIVPSQDSILYENEKQVT